MHRGSNLRRVGGKEFNGWDGAKCRKGRDCCRNFSFTQIKPKRTEGVTSWLHHKLHHETKPNGTPISRLSNNPLLHSPSTFGKLKLVLRSKSSSFQANHQLRQDSQPNLSQDDDPLYTETKGTNVILPTRHPNSKKSDVGSTSDCTTGTCAGPEGENIE